MLELKGKVKAIFDKQTFESGFEKREIVITTEEQYPQDIKVEFLKDKCSIIDNYKVGDSVTVGINLRGNEYKGNYYVSIVGWRISKSEQSTQPVGSSFDEVSSTNDDLPF